MTDRTTQMYDATYKFVLKEAVVAGQGALVTKAGALVEESAMEFLTHEATPDGFKLSGSLIQLKNSPSRIIGRPSLLAKRPWYRNYGHWLVDGAALIALDPLRLIPDGGQIVIGHYDNLKMRQLVLETIQAIAPGVDVLEHPDNEAWIFKELHYVTPVHVPPLFKLPGAIQKLTQSLKLSLLENDQTKTNRRRLFVFREADELRALVNIQSLFRLSCSHGFESYFPGRHSLAEQIEAFHDAEMVIGVKGAGLTNIMFCQPGSSILTLSPGDFPDPFFWDLASIAGLSYNELFGSPTSFNKASSHNPFSIYEPDFLAALDTILGEKCRSNA